MLNSRNSNDAPQRRNSYQKENCTKLEKEKSTELHTKSEKGGRQRETKREDIIYPSFCVVFSSTVFVVLFFFLYNRIWLLLHTCPLQIAPNLKVILVNDFLTQFYSKSGRPEIIILFVQKKKKRHSKRRALVMGKPVYIFLRC